MSSSIHASAVVHDGAKIGADVTIGPFCEVGPHVVLGDGVHLHGRATIQGATELGAGCEVFPGAVLGARAQTLGSVDDPENRLIVGPRSVFREFVSVHVGTTSHGRKTTIGADCYFMANSHVAHDCHVGDMCVFANGVALGGHCVIDEQVWIGGLAALHQFSQIGKHAFITGGTILRADVTPYCMAYGRGAYLAGVNVNGLKRRDFSRADIREIRRIYRELFETEGEFAGRLAALRDRAEPGSTAADFVEFIDRPGRGRPLMQPLEK